MTRFTRTLPLLMAMACSTVDSPEVVRPKNFIYFGLDRERIREATFLATPAIVGAQIKYRWQDLEPERDAYDLTMIREDLAFLQQHGKELFVQVQDVSFDDAFVNVPRYLRTDPEFGGGVGHQYVFSDDEDAQPTGAGWVARRWDPVVRARFIKLLNVLGTELDGHVTGLNLPETSVEFGDNGDFYPTGYTPQTYFDGVIEVMSAMRRAFSQSSVLQYANFMPGEWLPANDRGYLRGVYAHADSIGVGVGGPDLLPHRRGQQLHSYPLLANRGAHTVAGVAVQWGNLDDINPGTGRPVRVEELYRFARDSLRLDYLFWGTQEPHYTEAVLPYLATLSPGA